MTSCGESRSSRKTKKTTSRGVSASGVIGTGSSAIQSIPVIARQAKQLFVFQRTPYYSVPAHNKPLTDAELAAVKRDYDALRAKAGLSRNALVFRFPEKSAMELSEEERREEVAERGYEGFVLS